MSKYILFVCTGNTCRSPMAEALAVKMAEGTEYQIFSAGVSAWDGQPASENAVLAMKEEGLDLTGHVSQIISTELINNAALVLAMTSRHLDVIKSACPSANAHTLWGFAQNKQKDVSDPFGGDLNVYRKTAAEIKQLINLSLGRIKEGL